MSTTPTPNKTRLAPGELRARAAAVLMTAPCEEFSVAQVSRALSASGGAVGNALMTLAATGHAALAGDTPRRFRSTDMTAAVASSAAAVPVSAKVPSTSPKASRKKAQRRMIISQKAQVPAPVSSGSAIDYQCRELAGMPDMEALRGLRDAGVPVLLYGPPGTGKTTVVQAAFPDAITLCGDGDVQVSDFVGEWTQNPDGKYSFRYGPLVQAMTEGRVLFIDEVTLISPVVLASVYSALDGRRSITVKAHKGETITAAPGFWAIAGRNPGVAGEHLSEALASRFSVHVAVPSDLAIAEERGVNAGAVTVARNLATRVASGESLWAPQLRELLAFARLEKVLGTDAAFANLVGIAPEAERETVATIVASVTGSEARPLALGERIKP